MTRISHFHYFSLLIMSILLSSCIHMKRYPTAMQDTHQSMRRGIYDNLVLADAPKPVMVVPTIFKKAVFRPSRLKAHHHRVHRYQERFDVNANNVPAKVFFMGLVKDTRYNMVVRSEKEVNITLHLKNVTLEEALQAAHDAYGYEYRHTRYGIEVYPPELQTRSYKVNYLAVQRSGSSQMQLTTSQISEKIGVGGIGAVTGGIGGPVGISTTVQGSGVSVQTKAENDFWKQLEVALRSMIGEEEGRKITLNPQSGVVAIKAYPKELQIIDNYLNRIQQSLGRQVTIEAKILEVALSDSFQSGIDWTALGLVQTGSRFATSGFQGMITLTGSAGHSDFKTTIQLLEQQGNVQILSSPRLSTINNQEAVIKVGDDEFFVTGVTSNIVPSGTSATTSQSVTLTPFFSGITLDVIPEISGSDEVILHIHPSISDVRDQTKVVDFGNGSILTLPLAKSTIRESDNVVRAKNRQVIVIGGLMQNTTSETLSSTPVLSKIPFIGSFFRTTDQRSVKNELVILLKPIIANNVAWIERLQEDENQFQTWDRGFHIGSRPGVFGVAGECCD